MSLRSGTFYGMSPIELIPSDIRDLYTCHDFGHATSILAMDYPVEFADLCDALRKFRFTDDKVIKAGGNESEMPKAFSQLLRPDKAKPRWRVDQLNAKLVVNGRAHQLSASACAASCTAAIRSHDRRSSAVGLNRPYTLTTICVSA